MRSPHSEEIFTNSRKNSVIHRKDTNNSTSENTSINGIFILMFKLVITLAGEESSLKDKNFIGTGVYPNILFCGWL